MISILQLGTVDYATGLRLQQRLVSLRKEGRIGNVLLLLQHTPVITLGRNAKSHNVLASPAELERRGVEVFECDRGGDVTFHGPGQLVGYPIFDLRGMKSTVENRKSMGAVEFVRRIEAVLIRTCGEFGIATERVAGLTGVWTNPTLSQNRGKSGAPGGAYVDRGNSDSQPAKIAAIGVHISRGVTSHGFALNVNADLDYFKLIVPCGITSKPVTSMELELGREIDLSAVEQSVVRSFAAVFETETGWVESLDSLLENAVGVPLKAPEELRKLHDEEESFWV